MKLAGKLSIARRTSNVEPEYFVIEIEDAASGIEAVSVRVSPADLALAISGRANVPVEVEWRVDNVGKRAETKTEIVRCKIGATARMKHAAVAPFEVDGWRADQPGDRVVVVRVIDATTDPVNVGKLGRVVHLEYGCGCGQLYPSDPMIGVELGDGTVEEFWSEELALVAPHGGSS